MRKSEAEEPVDLGPGRLSIAGEAGQILARLPALRLSLPEERQGDVDRVARFVSYVQGLAQAERPAPGGPAAEREE